MQPPELELLVIRHVPGSGKADIRLAERGSANATYRVLRDGRAYALRLTAADSPDLGVDRLWESRVMTNAALADLAPGIEYCDPSRGILLTRWVDGRRWTAADARQPVNLSRIADLLRRVHGLPAPRPLRLMTPATWIERYSAAPRDAERESDRGLRGAAGLRNGAELLGAAGLRNGAELLGAAGLRNGAELRHAAEWRLALLAGLPLAAAPVVCHSDLHLLNLVDRGSSLILLDWEYAHVSEPSWDLAGWSANNDLDEALQREMLTAYLARTPSEDEQARLRLMTWLYDYVCWLWSTLYLSPARPANSRRAETARAEVAARARLLEARLTASAPDPRRAGQLPAH